MYLDYFDRFKDMKPYFRIEEYEWSHILETFDKDDVKETLAEVLMSYPIPYPTITENTLYKEYMKLKGIKYPDLLVEDTWYTKMDTYTYDLTYGDKQIYFRRNNVGNASSNYFQVKNRWSVSGTVSPGPERTWNSKEFMTTLMGAMYSMKFTHMDEKILRTMIGIRKYICSQFKPNVAKCIYDYFKSENVLDFSMGWGDRLAGFYASHTGREYVGIDPRTINHEIYKLQKDYYETNTGFFEDGKTSRFICDAAEDVNLTQYSKYFDTIFTSPPYFDVERYSEESTQSWVRHKNLKDWNEKFLHVALENVWNTLKPNGHLLVNISDIYQRATGKDIPLGICDPMNDFLSKFSDSEYKGCIGMELAKRPNCRGIQTGTEHGQERLDEVFCEPIWIWRKTDGI